MLLLLLGARTSVNESRSTRTALLHAISPDLSGREIDRESEGGGEKKKNPPLGEDLSPFTHLLEDDHKVC